MKKIYFKYRKRFYSTLTTILILTVVLFYKDNINDYVNDIVDDNNQKQIEESYQLKDIPDYHGNPYVVINNNDPFFDQDDLTLEPLEKYSSLDTLGRCGIAVAKIGIEIMPTEKRGSIGMIKPSGWHTVKYDIVDGKYLYNRCHLIGYQLAGENANPKNLITCTRYMNTIGMLPFENEVSSYVSQTKKHVLYRVTPIYDGDNLLAKGVLIEAESIEDKGQDFKFNVFIYNVQPGIKIDYKTGDSSLIEEEN